MIRFLSLIAASFLLFPLAGCGPSGAPVVVEDAFITLPPVAGRPGAGYFTLRSRHGPARLVSVSSQHAERIELHETVTVDGVTRMQPIDEVTFSPGQPARFEPGGRHLMLFGVDAELEAGQHIALLFRFDGLDPVEVQAEVRAPGGARHDGH